MPVGVLSLPLNSVLTGEPELIASTVFTSAAASVRFDFPTVYRTVMISGWAQSTLSSNLRYRLNNDSGANYSMLAWGVSSNTPSGTILTLEDKMFSNQNVSGIGGVWLIDAVIMKPSASTRAQMLHMCSAQTPASNLEMGGFGGFWYNTTDLLNRIDVFPSNGNFDTNTSISLWGFRK